MPLARILDRSTGNSSHATSPSLAYTVGVLPRAVRGGGYLSAESSFCKKSSATLAFWRMPRSLRKVGDGGGIEWAAHIINTRCEKTLQGARLRSFLTSPATNNLAAKFLPSLPPLQRGRAMILHTRCFALHGRPAPSRARACLAKML